MRLPDVDGQGIALRRPETAGKLIVINGTVWVLTLKPDISRNALASGFLRISTKPDASACRLTFNGWSKVHAIRGKPDGKEGVLAVNSHTLRQGCESLQPDQPRLELLPLGMAS